MNNIIEQMLETYEIKNINDEINALKEIIQYQVYHEEDFLMKLLFMME